MFKLIIEGLFLLFDTTKIQNYLDVCKCAYVYFNVKMKFFLLRKFGANWIDVCFQKFFIPFILYYVYYSVISYFMVI